MIIKIGSEKRRRNMEEKKEDRLTKLLKDVDKEFQDFNYLQQAKFAIVQISLWQKKLNRAKEKISGENIINTIPESNGPTRIEA